MIDGEYTLLWDSSISKWRTPILAAPCQGVGVADTIRLSSDGCAVHIINDEGTPFQSNGPVFPFPGDGYVRQCTPYISVLVWGAGYYAVCPLPFIFTGPLTGVLTEC